MQQAFFSTMENDDYIKAELRKKNEVWAHLSKADQERFYAQMIFQDDCEAEFKPWDKIKYIPQLHYGNILKSSDFFAQYKDEIREIYKRD
jgi:hypothetical protein